MGLVLAIDLGTTSVRAAVLEDGALRIVPGADRRPGMPCVVARTDRGTWLTGEAAVEADLGPESVVSGFHQLIGKKFDDPNVRIVTTFLPYAVVSGPNGDACVRLGGNDYHPGLLCALVIARLKSRAEELLRQAVEAATVTVPASFDARQAEIVREAVRMAGLEPVSVIVSSTAVGLAVCSERRADRVAVCDVGGGSTSVSILERRGGPVRTLATAGDPHVGGGPFDQMLVQWLVDEIHRRERVDLTGSPAALARLLAIAEGAKRRLTEAEDVEIVLPFGSSGSTIMLTRERFEQMLMPQLEWMSSACVEAIRGSGLSKDDLDAVIATGGSSRIPLVRRRLGKIFRREPELWDKEEKAAIGAALRGELNPPETPPTLVDCTRRSLGVKHSAGSVVRILEKNTSLPAERSRILHTRESRFELHLLEGESELASENLSLAKFVWELPFRREETPIQVTVTMDVQERIEVTLEDPPSGACRKLSVRSSSGLSEPERTRYRSEMESYLEGLLWDKIDGDRARLGELSRSEKLVLARKGDQSMRLELVRDADPVVWSTVLSSLETTALDVERIAALRDVSPAVLTAIGDDGRWTRYYAIVRELVSNPTTPQPVSMKLVDHLAPEDLERVSRGRELPRILRDQARTLLRMRG